jgi:hypothetical protein
VLAPTVVGVCGGRGSFSLYPNFVAQACEILFRGSGAIPTTPTIPPPQTDRQNVLISWECSRTRLRRLRGSIGLDNDRLTVPIHSTGVIGPADNASEGAEKAGHANLDVHHREQILDSNPEKPCQPGGSEKTGCAFPTEYPADERDV